jgi:hypothetical protein
MQPEFELVLFSTDPAFIRRSQSAGVQAAIIDLEWIGKQDRQVCADTEINRDTFDDLRRLRASTSGQILCRINGFGATTANEVEQAVEAGADEILLPMVRSVEEVQAVMDQVKGRAGVGVLVETVAAVELSKELARLPLARVYVGLNDLAIERKTESIFEALVDGTVERVRSAFSVPFGFGGLTLPDCGHPIPCRLLIGEMARLNCRFSFLRRSFYRDMKGRDVAVEVPRLLEAIRQARLRSNEEVARDRRELEQSVSNWRGALRQTEEAR